MKKTILIIGAIVAVIAVFLVGIFSVNGTAISYEEKVTEAKSAIKTQEKRRADLLPNLVDCVQAHDEIQYKTLVDTVAARKAEDGMITGETVDEVKSYITNVVVEAYPELANQKNYQELMNEMSLTENKIAETRDAYNQMVSRYNTYTRHPLRKFILSLTGYEKIEFQKLDFDVSEDAPTNLFD